MFCVSFWRQCWCFLPLLFRCFGASLEAVAVVAGFQNVAAMGETIEQCCGHFGIAKDAGPFTEAQVGGDDDAGALVEFAEKME
jgi:hypothetical protein